MRHSILFFNKIFFIWKIVGVYFFFTELKFVIVIQWVVSVIYKSQSPYALWEFVSCD